MFIAWRHHNEKLTLYHSWSSGKLLFKCNDNVILYHESNIFDFGTEHEFELNDVKFKLVVKNSYLWFKYYLYANDIIIVPEHDKMKKYSDKKVSFTDSTKKTSPVQKRVHKKTAEKKLEKLRKNNIKKQMDKPVEIIKLEEPAKEISPVKEINPVKEEEPADRIVMQVLSGLTDIEVMD